MPADPRVTEFMCGLFEYNEETDIVFTSLEWNGEPLQDFIAAGAFLKSFSALPEEQQTEYVEIAGHRLFHEALSLHEDPRDTSKHAELLKDAILTAGELVDSAVAVLTV